MDAINIARQEALNTPTGGDEYHLACTVCMLRGLDPFNFVPSAGLPNWQAVIAEQVVLMMLRASLRDNRGL